MIKEALPCVVGDDEHGAPWRHTREENRMPTHTLATFASQPPIEPLETTPQYVVLSSYPLGWQGMNAWRKHAVALPPLTQHQVLVQLNAGPRLLGEHDGDRYEGGWHRGDILTFRAGQPSQWQMANVLAPPHRPTASRQKASGIFGTYIRADARMS
jgi:hypothetical protein